MIKKSIEKKYVDMICSKIAESYPNTFHQRSMRGKAMSEKPIQLITALYLLEWTRKFKSQ